jgi:hypothetical protein
VSPPKGRRSAAGTKGKPSGRIVSASFGLGLVCGAALGCATLLVLLAYPEHRQALAVPDPGSLQPSAQSASPARTAEVPHVPSFEMTVRRDETGKAPLPLRVLGVDSSDNVRVALHNLPATARLSRGVRQDERTWILRIADLEGLQIMLGEGTPEAFDMTIEVATAAGAHVAEALARVQLSDRQEIAAASAPPPTTDSSIEPPSPTSRASPPDVGVPFRTQVEAAPPTAAQTQTASSRPPLPAGLSTLGGPTGEPTAAPPESRTVWWTLPARLWSPFADKASGN